MSDLSLPLSMCVFCPSPHRGKNTHFPQREEVQGQHPQEALYSTSLVGFKGSLLMGVLEH